MCLHTCIGSKQIDERVKRKALHMLSGLSYHLESFHNRMEVAEGGQQPTAFGVTGALLRFLATIYLFSVLL